MKLMLQKELGFVCIHSFEERNCVSSFMYLLNSMNMYYYFFIIIFFLTANDDDDYFDRSAEISEIDERLNRLQQLMKSSLP